MTPNLLYEDHHLYAAPIFIHLLQQAAALRSETTTEQWEQRARYHGVLTTYTRALPLSLSLSLHFLCKNSLNLL